jgi:hypothetical protein
MTLHRGESTGVPSRGNPISGRSPPPKEPALPKGESPAERRERYNRAVHVVDFLDKAVVAVSADNPSPQILQRNRKALALRVGEALRMGPLHLQVGPFGFSTLGRAIHNPGRRVDYVFNLFLDGVRGLVFGDEVTPRALGILIDVLAGEPPHGDDRVTWIWRKGLPGIDLRAVDVLLSDFEQTGDGELRLAQDWGQVRVRRGGVGDANEIVMLPRDDMRILRSSDRLAWVADVTVPSNGAKEVRGLAHEVRKHAGGRTDWPRFMLHIMRAAGFGGPRAVCPSPLLGGLVDSLVAEERDEDLAAMLRAFARYDSAEARRIRSLVLTAERLTTFAPALQRLPDDIADPLSLMAESLGGALASLILSVKGRKAELLMFEIAQAVGDELALPCYVRQLDSDDVEQVLNAIPPLARSTETAALVGLGKALMHRAPAVRRAGMRALAGRYHEDLRDALVRMTRDKDRANCLGALSILRDSQDPRVVLPLLALAKADDFARRSPDERKAFYRCLAVIGDNRGFTFLEGIIEGRKLVGRAPSSEDQLLVVRAMGRAGPSRARRILATAKARGRLSRPVRKAAAEALLYWRTV